MARACTAIGVSPIIKELVQKKALAIRLRLKEIIYVGMLTIYKLEKKRWQELAGRVHQMQVNGEIWGKKGSRTFGEMSFGAIAYSTKTAGVPQSNGIPLSAGRNAREAYSLNKLSINAAEFLQYVIQYCHETSPDSMLQAPSNAWTVHQNWCNPSGVR